MHPSSSSCLSTRTVLATSVPDGLSVARRRRQSGVTVLEILAVGTITGMVTLTALSYVQTWPSRLALRGSAEQTMFLISQARLEAIRRGVTTVVEADLERGELRAYADVNGDPQAGRPGYAHYLRYDPGWVNGAFDPDYGSRQSDYEIGFLKLERVHFAGPEGGEPVVGFTAVPAALPGTPPVLVFSPSGVPEAPGSFRFGDLTGLDGAPLNVVETAVVSLTGKVEIRKYLHPLEAPGGNAGFYAEGRRANGENLWLWY